MFRFGMPPIQNFKTLTWFMFGPRVGPDGIVRYPTCLRKEIDSNANTISAQHPNSDTRIKITHGFTENLTISSPYEPRPDRSTVFLFLFIFPPYSRREPRWFLDYDLYFDLALIFQLILSQGLYFYYLCRLRTPFTSSS